MGAREDAGRTILHVDMDAFFASVEQHDHPEWKGKPLIVGALPDERGVVSTCSYEARKFGVRSAMPSREAGRLCPRGIFIHGNHARYSEVSRQVFAIFERYTPFVQPVSIDEAFLDVSGALGLFGDAKSIANGIRESIRGELGITASVGIAPNMFLAKIASDMHKPDGLTIVPREPGAIRDFLAPLPVRRIWGVGKTLEMALQQEGIRAIRDLQEASVQRLSRIIGRHAAESLKALALGLDDRRLDMDDGGEKSISREHTFPDDTSDLEGIRAVIADLAADVARRVRKEGLYAALGKIKLRWKDFRTITRQSPFESPCNDDITFREKAEELFAAAYHGGEVRLIGFGVEKFSDSPGKAQPSLFDDGGEATRAKREKVCRAVDSIRDRLGSDLHFGAPPTEG